MIIDHPSATLTPALKSLWREAFRDTDAFIDAFFETAYSPTRSMAAVEDGEVCAALYFFDCEYHGSKVAYVYAVATAERHRGRGICRRLMEHTHGHLKALGYAAAILVPGDKSLFSLYEKMGYRICSHVDKIFVVPDEEDTYPSRVELTQIDISQYAALRRKYLPKNGIVQEGECLRLLSEYADFFSFPVGVFAAYGTPRHLQVVELLGDDSVLDAITLTFHSTAGSFLTPGTKEPFAMCIDLAGTLDDEVYFGLALN